MIPIDAIAIALSTGYNGPRCERPPSIDGVSPQVVFQNVEPISSGAA